MLSEQILRLLKEDSGKSIYVRPGQNCAIFYEQTEHYTHYFIKSQSGPDGNYISEWKVYPGGKVTITSNDEVMEEDA